MRHGIKFRKLNMSPSHRYAVLRNLALSLIKTSRVETTLAKAKELRSFVEPIITASKSPTLHNKRLVISKLGSSASALLPTIEELGVRFKERKGGYLRIVKTGNRYGDYASCAVVEFV